MIDSIQIQGFKSLRDVSLRLGALNIFVGTNASGKSNFFDALRVVQGLGYGFTINEILDGKPQSSTSVLWEAIRGGSAGAAFRGPSSSEHHEDAGITICVSVSGSPLKSPLTYTITFEPVSGRVVQESLSGPSGLLYDTAPVESYATSRTIKARLYKGTPGRPAHVDFERARPVLHQLNRSFDCPSEWNPILLALAIALCDLQRVDPSPDHLREYSKGSLANRMGERGENFAALVQAILNDPASAGAYTAWLQQLTPAELDRVEILKGAVQEPLFALRKDGHTFAAPVLSDGTLRFAAIAATFFQSEMPRVLLIEDIEKGIHPTRLRLLVDLLKSQAKREAPQVMATTHSPVVLSWLDPADYGTVFLCAKEESTGASIIKPLSELPQFRSVVSRQPVGDLFAEGWMESAL